MEVKNYDHSKKINKKSCVRYDRDVQKGRWEVWTGQGGVI